MAQMHAMPVWKRLVVCCREQAANRELLHRRPLPPWRSADNCCSKCSIDARNTHVQPFLNDRQRKTYFIGVVAGHRAQLHTSSYAAILRDILHGWNFAQQNKNMTSDILQFSTRAAINITAKTERVGKTWIHKEIGQKEAMRFWRSLSDIEIMLVSYVQVIIQRKTFSSTGGFGNGLHLPWKPTKSIPQSFMHKFAMTMPGPHFVDDAIILDGLF